MVQDICRDIVNSEVEECLEQLKDSMNECIGNLDTALEIRQLLTVIKMRQDYWDRSWTESFFLANRDVDRILRLYDVNLAKKDHLKKLQKTISETLYDTTEDLKNIEFCVVCHKEHGKLKLSYLLEQLESGNPDIVQNIIQEHSGKGRENGGMDTTDMKQSSSTSSTDGYQSTQCSESWIDTH